MQQHPVSHRQWIHQQFFLCFVLMVLIIGISSCYYFILSRKAQERTAEYDVLTVLSKYPSCSSWYGKVRVEPGSVCIHQYPDPDMYTHADVEFWNFGQQRWESGSTSGDLSHVEILRSKLDDTGKSAPLLMRCTWGCAVGKYDEYLRDFGNS